MFRLRRLSEDDTIFLVEICAYLRICIAVSVLVAMGRFFNCCVYSKRHPYTFVHECLSTIINKVISVQVYYNTMKNITMFKMTFLIF